MKQELTLWYEIFSELFMRILELEKTASCKICISYTVMIQSSTTSTANSLTYV